MYMDNLWENRECFWKTVGAEKYPGEINQDKSHYNMNGFMSDGIAV